MYQCKKCGREFKEKRYLTQHLGRKTPCDKELQCSKCYKVFKKRQHLESHMNRKTPCAPEEVPVIPEDNPDNRCQFCNRTYSTPSNLKRHQKTCDREANMAVIMEKILQQNQRLEEKFDKQSQEMKELKQQLTLPSQTINIDNRQLNVINFVNFPIQDMSKIDMQPILQIAQTKAKNQIIPAIVEHIHGNPKYPENQNVFMTKINSEMTFVYGGEKEKTWHSIPSKKAFRHLKNEAMGLLTHNDQPMANFRLLEAAYEAKDRDTSYQDKIADLSECDTTEDSAIAEKLVEFHQKLHLGREITHGK